VRAQGANLFEFIVSKPFFVDCESRQSSFDPGILSSWRAHDVRQSQIMDLRLRRLFVASLAQWAENTATHRAKSYRSCNVAVVFR
jgi:hypothetical protein